MEEEDIVPSQQAPPVDYWVATLAGMAMQGMLANSWFMKTLTDDIAKDAANGVEPPAGKDIVANLAVHHAAALINRIRGGV